MYIYKKKETLANKIYITKDKYYLQEFKKGLIDHKNELALIKAHPYYHIISESYKGIIYKNIVGTKINRNQFNILLSKIILATKNLHLMSLDLPNFWLDIIPNWILLISDKNIRKYMKDLYDKLSFIINTKYINELMVPSHHNINHKNILLQDNNIIFINFEYVYKNYLYVDIGNIICENIFNENKQEYNFQKIDDNLINKIKNIYDPHLNINKIKLGINIYLYYKSLISILEENVFINSNFNYNKFINNNLNYIIYNVY